MGSIYGKVDGHTVQLVEVDPLHSSQVLSHSKQRSPVIKYPEGQVCIQV